jgi:hypothetical protein
LTEKSSTPKKKPFFGITLSETILLATIPFFAYLFTFVYQAGFLKAFELPLQFVSVNIVDIFNIGSKVLGVFAFVLGLINLFSALLPKDKIPFSLEKRLSQLVPLLLFTFPAIFLFEWGAGSNLVAFFLIVVIVIMFLPPLVTKKYKGTYLQRMEMLDSEIKGSNPWEGSLIDRTVDFIGYKAFIVIVYFLLSINLTYNAGKAAAFDQEIYHIVNTSPETVVLFMTNDKIISAPFDKNAKLVEPNFFVIDLSSAVDLKLRLVNTGRLKLDTSSLTPLPTPTLTPLPSQTPTATLLPISTPTP